MPLVRWPASAHVSQGGCSRVAYVGPEGGFGDPERALMALPGVGRAPIRSLSPLAAEALPRRHPLSPCVLAEQWGPCPDG